MSANSLTVAALSLTLSKYLTISAGIISIIPSIEDNIDTVMKKADDRLYEAKERGRNNFVFD